MSEPVSQPSEDEEDQDTETGAAHFHPEMGMRSSVILELKMFMDDEVPSPADPVAEEPPASPLSVRRSLNPLREAPPTAGKGIWIRRSSEPPHERKRPLEAGHDVRLAPEAGQEPASEHRPPVGLDPSLQDIAAPELPFAVAGDGEPELAELESEAGSPVRVAERASRSAHPSQEVEASVEEDRALSSQAPEEEHVLGTEVVALPPAQVVAQEPEDGASRPAAARAMVLGVEAVGGVEAKQDLTQQVAPAQEPAPRGPVGSLLELRRPRDPEGERRPHPVASAPEPRDAVPADLTGYVPPLPSFVRPVTPPAAHEEASPPPERPTAPMPSPVRGFVAPPLVPPPPVPVPPAPLPPQAAVPPQTLPANKTPMMHPDDDLGVALGAGQGGSVPLQPGDVKLVIEQGMSLGKEFLISDKEMLVGRRDPERQFMPDIDLFDQEAPTNRFLSRRQARLLYAYSGLWVEDLNSSNGSALNGVPLEPNKLTAVQPGDKIMLGQSVLVRVRLVKS